MRRTAPLLLACVAFTLAGVLPAHADDDTTSEQQATSHQQAADAAQRPSDPSSADDTSASPDVKSQDANASSSATPSGPVDDTAADDTAADDTAADDKAAPDEASAEQPDGDPTALDTAVTAAQEADVKVVAVAIADSGGNIVTGGDPAVSERIGADLATGAATAVGSEDVTHVSQQATTALSGQATADITQMVVVFNVGIAAANSGGNNGGNGGSGASIATGDAHVVGNDSSTYLTQGATAAAGAGTSDTTSQVAMTVRMGIGIGNSGGNSIAAGTVQASGSVQTGAATAVGNSSLTDVDQVASLSGSGSAHLTVDQRAMILNLGVALANTGLNELGTAADAMLASPDQDDAQQLLSLLLPALLTSPQSGAAATSTGNATAIGNSSQTYVSQTAVAAASGDGSVAISQHVVVANVGVAVANTGGNDGAVGAIDPMAAAQFADFITQLFDTMNRWQQSGGEPVAGSVWLELTIGDTVIRIDGSLSGTATQSGNQSGAHANVRQISAIISIGVASANTGDNTQRTAGADVATTAMAATTTPVMIITGNVDASNAGTTIVCQLVNSSVPCLGPPEEPGWTGGVEPVPSVRVTSPAPAAVASGPASAVASASGSAPSNVGSESATLPATGTDAIELLRLAAYLAALGCLLLLAAAGRRRPSAPAVVEPLS